MAVQRVRNTNGTQKRGIISTAIGALFGLANDMQVRKEGMRNADNQSLLRSGMRGSTAAERGAAWSEIKDRLQDGRASRAELEKMKWK